MCVVILGREFQLLDDALDDLARHSIHDGRMRIVADAVRDNGRCVLPIGVEANLIF